MNQNIKCAADLRRMYLKFFESKGHAVIPSASVIPENDPTVLFTTAGMHPLVPYLLGAKHPMGNRLTDVQKCIRTGDIDEVGDASHCTFFEMLGNWSLGAYFKKEAIHWSWEFLTSPEWLGLDPEKLAFSVFAGDEKAPRDDEAAGYWKECGVKDDHIFYLNAKHNWWGPAGTTGPCGPDTEMFVIKDQPPCGPDCSPACSCGRYLEIWNDVFMQYNKQADGTFPPLEQKNVDTGMGLERTIGVLLGAKTVYETDLFSDIIKKIEELSGKTYTSDDEYTRSFRIIADHMRTATIIIGDDRGVTPSNVDQGYVLRRLIRRSVRHGMKLEMPEGMTAEIAKVVVNQYKDVYPELKRNEEFITSQLLLEEERFQKTLKQGMKEFDKLLFNISRMTNAVKPVADTIKAGEDFASQADAAAKQLPPRPEYQALIALLKDKSDKDALLKEAEAFLGNLNVIDGRSAFKLYDTYGFPIEITTELAAEKQAAEAIKDEALRCGMYYVNVRWPGGMLTNFKTIKRSIARLNALNKMAEDGTFDLLPKKEVAALLKEREALEKNYGGIKEMPGLPECIFIVDPRKERNAVLEAKKLGIPVVAIVDTNCDPDDADYVIPGNDDAIRAIKLISSALADAVLEGKQGEQTEEAEAPAEEAEATDAE